MTAAEVIGLTGPKWNTSGPRRGNKYMKQTEDKKKMNADEMKMTKSLMCRGEWDPQDSLTV